MKRAKHKLKSLYVFGSAIDDTYFNERSDVDFLYEFDLENYLDWVTEAIKNLESFTSKITLDEPEQIELKWAIEKGISIIGEAMYKGYKIDKNLPISNLKNIIGMRHIVIHDYDVTDSERLYITVKKYISNFKKAR